MGTIVLAVLIVRVIDQPALGHDVPNELISIQAPAYLGLLAAAALAAGAWLAHPRRAHGRARERLRAAPARAPRRPRPEPPGGGAGRGARELASAR